MREKLAAQKKNVQHDKNETRKYEDIFTNFWHQNCMKEKHSKKNISTYKFFIKPNILYVMNECFKKNEH